MREIQTRPVTAGRVKSPIVAANEELIGVLVQSAAGHVCPRGRSCSIRPSNLSDCRGCWYVALGIDTDIDVATLPALTPAQRDEVIEIIREYDVRRSQASASLPLGI